MIEFVTASHDEAILHGNLSTSEIFQGNVPLQVMKSFNNVPAAYNSPCRPMLPIPAAYTVYVHHDVYLPPSFECDLYRSLVQMQSIDKNWGVLGVAGVNLIDGKKWNSGNIKDRGREWGCPVGLPAEVDTLDEMLLITHGDFQFDEQFDLHFYGADICMQAKLQGRKCYAINAYCHHNSGLPFGHRSQSFRDCEAKFRAKYIDHLPIATTCSMLTS
jgi:hypothetical protein